MRGASDSELRSAALSGAFDLNEQLDTARTLLEKQGAKVELPPMLAALEAAGFSYPVSASTPPKSGTDFASAARQDLPFESPVQLGLPVATSPAIRATSVAGPFRSISAAGSFASSGDEP
jgi:hypothetical protein